MNFGVQTFTIRKAQKKSIRDAYLPLIEMGVKRFEVARIAFTEENARELSELIKEYGIEIVSLQVKPKKVFLHFDEVVDFAHKVGSPSVVISQLPFSCVLRKEKKFFEWIATLDEWYDRYEKEGIVLAYHHHHWEYVTLSTGKTRMQELLLRTQKIKFVHDTYWTTKCGFSSVAQMREFGSRLLGVHLRDMTLYKKGVNVLSRDCAVGDGMIDFSAVCSEAERVGASYLVIEQKTKTPYTELRKSFAVLNTLQISTEQKE